jgi:hypothetical protein
MDGRGLKPSSCHWDTYFGVGSLISLEACLRLYSMFDPSGNFSYTWQPEKFEGLASHRF